MGDLLKCVKRDVGWPERKALHFKDLKHDNREVAVRLLTKDKSLFRAISVMVHKPCLSNPEAFQQQNRLYFYFTRYVLERASWLCRDSREGKNPQQGDGTAKVIFSSMNEVSKVRISEYFAHLQSLDTEIDWRVIKGDQFETLTPGRHAGLQIADCIAAGFYCTGHHCERKKTDRWADLLRPVIYRSPRGKYRGYGLKIFPSETEKQIAQGAIAPWANVLFPK